MIYNVTYGVDLDIEQDFLDWIRGKYVPMAVASGELKNPRLALIMTTEEQERHHNYSLQFEVESLDVLESWSLHDGNKVLGEFTNHFGNKAPGFPTLMEKVEL